MSTNRDWIRWGERDAYFGVLSSERFRAKSIALHREEFFQSGEEEIERITNFIRQVYGDCGRNVAIDFGCGVGRLTIPLSRNYEHVIGLDISPGMIAEAKNNCALFGTRPVEFCCSLDSLVSRPPFADLAISRIVLQHIPPDVGMGLIGDLLSCLLPGGVASLHVTTKRTLSAAKELIYFIKHHVPLAHYALNLLQRKRWNEPLMQMNDYPLYGLIDLYLAKGMTDIFLEPTYGSSMGFILYARKYEA
jgi:SAM-dependent methyltransferase